jgi:hypothetical protein
VRVETNVKLARRMRQIAQYLMFVTFGVPLVGLFLINTQLTDVFIAVVMPALILIVALIITVISVRLANLWVRVPRPEDVIPESLKGIGKQSVLYNYYHFPARHVLIVPQGVFALHVMFQDGRFTVDQDRWTRRQTGAARFLSFLRFDSIGEPTKEAQAAAAHVKKLLQPIAGDIDVQPLIVFIDPKVEVEVGETSVPIVAADGTQNKGSIKDYLYDLGRGKYRTLSPEQIEAFETATLR